MFAGETRVQSQIRSSHTKDSKKKKKKKIVLDASSLTAQHYKVQIKDEWSNPGTLHLSVVAIEKGAFESPSTIVGQLNYSFAHSQMATSIVI